MIGYGSGHRWISGTAFFSKVSGEMGDYLRACDWAALTKPDVKIVYVACSHNAWRIFSGLALDASGL